MWGHEAEKAGEAPPTGVRSQECGESRRGRVRRLLIAPLVEAGFRRPRGVTAEKHEAELSSICDHVAYLSDDAILALRQELLPKGQGRDRNIWPSLATVVGHAEYLEQRPIEELDALLRWFRSRAGPEARADGTLVESYRAFRKFKVPPARFMHMIRREAAESRDKMRLIEDRIARGVAMPEELTWRREYLAELAHVERLVDEGEAARAAAHNAERTGNGE